ncbi:hypothetical protein CIB95_09000 [Lottiidibacillus patelloidae]|uniref:Uncharacterized protein n=1 Tax=Lottiidibacillus patelloidae TaxID=2670334 RepID=A0A263BU93_9BACI|nr:hypothetical protein [Lottiidibacillus patelloidae]OZM56897.1 hypothetical protein CIB95_09000 [Lottiidibacillus patelloidae]
MQNLQKWLLKIFRVSKVISLSIWKFTKMHIIPLVILLSKLIWKGVLQLYKLLSKKIIPFIYAFYKGLSPQNRKRLNISFAVVLILCLTIAFVLPNFNQHIGVSKSQKELDKLVDVIVTGSWEEQQDTVKEILSSVGITYAEDDVPQNNNALFVIPPELTLLTYDASLNTYGGRLTLEDLAYLLRDAGFPFKEGEDPALIMRNGVSAWVKKAQDDPKQDGSMAPLFLQAMAKAQSPSISLEKDDWQPQDYRMTYLEIHVFLGSILQAVREEETKTSMIDWLMPKANAADAAGTCSIAKDWFGDITKQEAAEISTFKIDLVNFLISELIGKGFDSISKEIGKVLTSVGIGLKVLKLAMLYWAIEVKVEADHAEIHKQGINEKTKEVAYKAIVGVNEEKYQQYLKQWNSSPVAKEIRDCFSFIGLPMPTDTGDIAADVENWSVEWDIVHGGGIHAYVGKNNVFDLPGQFQMSVKRVSKNKAEANFLVDIIEENNDHEGKEKRNIVTVRALVETSAPPALGTFLNGIKLGYGTHGSDNPVFDLLSLTSAIADVVAGWFQEMVEPEAYGFTHVVYHEVNPDQYAYEGVVRVMETVYDEYDDTIETVYLVAKGNIRAEYSVGTQHGHFWNVSGFASSEAKYSFQYGEEYENGCVGGTVLINSQSSHSGDASAQMNMRGKLTIRGSKEEGYTSELNLSGDNSQIIISRGTSTEVRIAQGCDYVRSSNWSDDVEYDTMYSAYFPNLYSLQMPADGVFPKQIKGSHQVVDGNKVTIWSWVLARVDKK